MAKRKGKTPRPRARNRQATRVYLQRVPAGMPQRRATCIMTGKECFDTEAACWRWIEQCGKIGLCVPYRCLECMKIHMTSNEITVGKRMRERTRGF